jgi:hypothetical protein
MGARLGVVRAGEQSALAIAAHSGASLDRALRFRAELWVAIAGEEGVLLGAFQRSVGIPDASVLVRRGSGGPAVRVGEGTVHVALALASPDALVPCDQTRIANRMVRPLLRALSKSAGARAPAHFFGRDWVSVAHRPAAWVGFAHDATTRRTLFEAFVAVRAPFALTQRPSFLGKVHGTLESIVGRPFDPEAVAESIIEAYTNGTEPTPLDRRDVDAAVRPDTRDPRADPPWTAVGEEAIGVIGAGPDHGGTFRVGGDLLVSRDALGRLEALAAVALVADLASVVNETLAAPGVALEGVRSLGTVCDVIRRARGG